MTTRRRRPPAVWQLWVFTAVITLAGMATSCVSPGAPREAPPPDGESAGFRDAPPEEEPSPTNEELPPPPQRDWIVRSTADYWLETPWFGVNAVIVRVTERPLETAFIVPDNSPLRPFFGDDPRVIPNLGYVQRGMRFRLGVAFAINGAPPFVDADRYRYPELYD